MPDFDGVVNGYVWRIEDQIPAIWRPVAPCGPPFP
jgi:hypothetical protein